MIPMKGEKQLKSLNVVDCRTLVKYFGLSIQSIAAASDQYTILSLSTSFHSLCLSLVSARQVVHMQPYI